MIKVDNLSANANQVSKISLSDGSIVAIFLTYLAAVQRWSMTVEKDSFSVTAINVNHNPNLLRPWKETQKFGIACIALDGVDPVLVDDFASGRASLYILELDDLVLLEREVYS